MLLPVYPIQQIVFDSPDEETHRAAPDLAGLREKWEGREK